ncbi:hypothetical protein K5549_017965, partial [Capra hircus]
VPARPEGEPRASGLPERPPPGASLGTGDRGAAITQWLPAPQSSKPVMEKRRRARINESLAQLQSLLLDALRKESSRRSKLEKADILELTVRHLQSLRRVQVTGEARAAARAQGRPPPPAFDGPCPLPRPGAALAPIFLPRLVLAAPGAGAQGQGAPWRPWLR